MKRLLPFLLLFFLAACGSKPLIPDKSLNLMSGFSLSAGKLAATVLAGVAIYFIYDPLAPNWEIEEARLSEDTYRFDMKMKRYNTGGAGESMQILRRRAAILQRERGYDGYELLEYTEGIESKTLGAQRVAEGTIKLVRHQPAATTEQLAAVPPPFVVPPQLLAPAEKPATEAVPAQHKPKKDRN